MLKDGVIYAKSLMILIDENYAYEFLGYKELKRDNPSEDRIYNCAKEFARDNNLKKQLSLFLLDCIFYLQEG